MGGECPKQETEMERNKKRALNEAPQASCDSVLDDSRRDRGKIIAVLLSKGDPDKYVSAGAIKGDSYGLGNVDKAIRVSDKYGETIFSGWVIVDEEGTKDEFEGPFMSDDEEIYFNAPVDVYIEKFTPIIMRADPQLFVREQISVANVESRLRTLYPDEADYRSACWEFNAHYRSIAFYFAEAVDKDPDDLRESIDGLKELFAGKQKQANSSAEDENIIHLWTRKIPIPAGVRVREKFYPQMMDFNELRRLLEETMYFLRPSEIQKITMKIFSAGLTAEARAKKMEEVCSKYFLEARELVTNKANVFPGYYLEESSLRSLIVRVRNSVVIPLE